MTPEQFTYWIQGFFEIAGVGTVEHPSINADQTKVIRDHLQLVFKKETPPYLDSTTGVITFGSGTVQNSLPAGFTCSIDPNFIQPAVPEITAKKTDYNFGGIGFKPTRYC